jgi:hypothetical protein
VKVELKWEKRTKLRTFDVLGLTALELATLRTALYSLRETKMEKPTNHPIAPYMPEKDEQDMAREMYPHFQEAAMMARKKT